MPTEQLSSPLDTIKMKERELSRRLDAIRQQADAECKRARSEAEKRRTAAHEQALAEAKDRLEQTIASAEDQAQAIRASAQESAEQLWEHRRDRVPRIADIVVTWVLPTQTNRMWKRIQGQSSTLCPLETSVQS